MTEQQTIQKVNYSKGLSKIIIRFLKQNKFPVGLIYGNPDTGKTDTAFKIAEIGQQEGYLDHFASNVNTKDAGQKITSLEDVKFWHRHQVGSKLYILDEAGINDDARSPLSRLNREIRHEIFIARKFQVHWLFILQELKDIDNWKNSNLTGMKVLKDSRGFRPHVEFTARIKLKWEEDYQDVYGFPRTTIPFDTLDIASFTLEKQLNDEELQLKGVANQIAYGYATGKNFSQIAQQLKQETGQEWKNMQVIRELRKYLKQSLRMQVEQSKA